MARTRARSTTQEARANMRQRAILKTQANTKSDDQIRQTSAASRQVKSATSKKQTPKRVQETHVNIDKATTKTAPSNQGPRTNDPLPPGSGPKLHIFKHHNAEIVWIERLDDDEGDHKEGHVFRAKIKQQEYAIKVFKDFDVESERFYWETFLDPDHDIQEVAYFMDPFYSECRAYGRIKDALARKTLLRNPAMPCYGYLLLSKEDEAFLAKWNPFFRSDSSTDRNPLRAIVKKLGIGGTGITARRQAKLCRDLQQLRKLRIFNRDIRADNYQDGLLVDFGSSITEPHIIFDAFEQHNKDYVYSMDVGQYKGMLDDEGISLKYDPMEPLPILNVDTRLRESQREKKLNVSK